MSRPSRVDKSTKKLVSNAPWMAQVLQFPFIALTVFMGDMKGVWLKKNLSNYLHKVIFVSFRAHVNIVYHIVSPRLAPKLE